MASTQRADTTTSARVHGRLTHTGACGVRIPCWRAECRRTFAPYRTVEVLALALPPNPDWAVIAFCHRDRMRAGELSPRIWIYVSGAVAL